ncbi:cell division protein ZapA [Pseudomonadota bacterium]
MARVSIIVNGYAYDIACADGEEDHISELAKALDAKVGELVGAIGQAGEARLLAMAGLLMADELAEARAALENVPESAPEPTPAEPEIDADRLADALDAMAARMETIADGLENA